MDLNTYVSKNKGPTMQVFLPIPTFGAKFKDCSGIFTRKNYWKPAAMKQDVAAWPAR